MTLIVMLAFAGLAVDLSNWSLHGDRMQRAADAGALARFVVEVPDGVVTVVTEAYCESVDDPAFPDAIASAVRRGRMKWPRNSA